MADRIIELQHEGIYMGTVLEECNYNVNEAMDVYMKKFGEHSTEDYMVVSREMNECLSNMF